MCLIILYPSVWPAMDSASGDHTDMRPVSVEPVELGAVQSEKKFSWKVTNGGVTKEKIYSNTFLKEVFAFNNATLLRGYTGIIFSFSLNGSTF